MRPLLARSAVVITLLAAALLVAPAAHAAGKLRVTYSFGEALLAGTLAPEASPPGANDWSCRPSAAHPRPVVLVHGTVENMNDNFRAIAPQLANDGYCVFALNYGSVARGFAAKGTKAIQGSAAQLAAFVDRVRAATGTAEVDIVGHSQGGMMPRYYLRFGGGADKVHSLVALTPSNHGTDFDGLFLLAAAFGGAPRLIGAACPACEQQIVGSAFLHKLNAGFETVPGVRYTVITTRNDDVVTPYTSAFLHGPGVTSVTVQDGCPRDQSDHLSISYSRRAIGYVRNALDPAHATPPPCVAVLPLLGG